MKYSIKHRTFQRLEFKALAADFPLMRLIPVRKKASVKNTRALLNAQHILPSERRAMFFFSDPKIKKIIQQMPAELRVAVERLKSASPTERAGAITEFSVFVRRHSKGASEKALVDFVERRKFIKHNAFKHSSLVTPFLHYALKDPDPGVRLSALTALQILHSKSSIPRVEARLKDVSPEVRMEAIKTLTFIGSKKSIPNIEERLADKDPRVQQTASKAIKRLGEKAGAALLTKIKAKNRIRKEIRDAEKKLASNKAQERIDAINTLFFFGSAKSLKKVSLLLDDPHPEVRRRAAFFVQVFSKDLASHPLYFEHRSKKNFFSKKRRLARAEFEKTGSRLLLLGGKLSGKAIVRIIPASAFEAWKKALEAKEEWRKAGFDYIPVEPIFTKNGVLRAKKTRSGKVMVIAGVLGKSLNLFLSDVNNSRYRDLLERDCERIIQVLRNIGVEHGHIHADNFCVQLNRGKPRVYIIDFDRASIVK